MNDNPYQAPIKIETTGKPHGTTADLTSSAEMLRSTRPWVRTISVVMFVFSALTVLIGMISALGGAAMAGPFGLLLGAVYIFMAILYAVPALYLWWYASRINVFLRDQTTGSLAFALEAQKSFWKFIGISTLVVIVVYVMVILVVVVGGVASSM